MSILSLLSGLALMGLVYGLSFLPSASLTRPDDEVGLGLVDATMTGDESSDDEGAST